MSKVRVVVRKNDFYDVGLDVQRRIFPYLDSEDQHNFAVTEKRIYNSFHPSYLMFLRLNENLVHVRAQQPFSFFLSQGDLIPNREYVERVEDVLVEAYETLER